MPAARIPALPLKNVSVIICLIRWIDLLASSREALWQFSVPLVILLASYYVIAVQLHAALASEVALGSPEVAQGANSPQIAASRDQGRAVVDDDSIFEVARAQQMSSFAIADAS